MFSCTRITLYKFPKCIHANRNRVTEPIRRLLLKVKLSPSKKSFLITSMNSLQKWWKWLLFHGKNSFRSWDIYIYFLTYIYLCYLEKQFDKKAMNNFKIFWHHRLDNRIALHILSSISRNKDNQTMKFIQLIEYKMRNIFIEQSYKKCGGKASTRLFIKNQY